MLSDHESEAKTELRELLVMLGATPQKDCPMERCQKEYARNRARWEGRHG